MATEIKVRWWWQGLAQIFVAEAIEQETSLADKFEETTFPGTDWLQSAETATLLLYRFADGIKDAVRRFRFSNYGERLQIALISGPGNLHQPADSDYAFA